MLIAFLILIVTAWLCQAYGGLAVYLLGKTYPELSRFEPGLPFRLILGLAFITTLGSFFSLLFRINWEFQAVLVLGGAAIQIWLRPLRGLSSDLKLLFRGRNILLTLGLGLGGLILLNAAILIPSNPDTGIYHAQTIHWIETYPAVPGLAHLHQRLGYNSSWLLASAVFSYAFLGIQSFHLTSGFLFMAAGLYFGTGLRGLFQRQAGLSDLLKTGFLLSMFVFLLDQASSPGTDAPATLLVWICLAECAAVLEKEPRPAPGAFMPAILLAVFSLTVKISTLPLALITIPVLFVWIRQRAWKPAAMLAGLVGLILLPFFARGLILTGYPLFPGPAIDLFHFDWRLPLDSHAFETRVIRAFAILPNLSFEEFEQLTLRQWLPMWFANLIPRHKALLLAVLGLPLGLAAIFGVRRFREVLQDQRWSGWVFLLCYVGILFWFVGAPAFRFGYGFILSALMLGLSLLARIALRSLRWLPGFVGHLIVPLVLAGILVFARPTLQPGTFMERALLPVDYPGWSTQACEFKDFKVFCAATYNACWYDAFPCALEGNPQVEMRGPEYRQGFRLAP